MCFFSVIVCCLLFALLCLLTPSSRAYIALLLKMLWLYDYDILSVQERSSSRPVLITSTPSWWSLVPLLCCSPRVTTSSSTTLRSWAGLMRALHTTLAGLSWTEKIPAVRILYYNYPRYTVPYSAMHTLSSCR